MRGVIAGLLGIALLCAACGGPEPATTQTRPPAVGGCRNLTSQQTTELSDATKRVACTAPHNAQTFASGSLPEQFAKAERDDDELDLWAYRTCSASLTTWLAGDDSMVMRSVLTWIWFRPSPEAWDAGARWFRCDVLGGSAGSERLIDLPTTTQELMAGRPDDRWMACARGTSPARGVRGACTQRHDWRAVTTIKLGEATTTYPGDEAVQAKTKSYCKRSVGAWLGYPADYDYGYTWFGRGEWAAGNRRGVCWAKTDQ